MSRRTLEIGIGSSESWPPEPTMLQSARGGLVLNRYFDQDLYVGIDMPDNQERRWVHWFAGEEPKPPATPEERRQTVANLAITKAMFAESRPTENINFLIADAHNLPFADGSFGEIFIGNVLGSQLVEQSLLQILQSARRVLAPDGHLVIRESYTPQWFMADEVPHYLERCGFILKELVTGDQPAYQDFLSKYGESQRDVANSKLGGIVYEAMARERYFCVAKPAAI